MVENKALVPTIISIINITRGTGLITSKKEEDCTSNHQDNMMEIGKIISNMDKVSF